MSRIWYPERRSPQGRKYRFWWLGADLGEDGMGSLRIYRKACGAKRDANKCLVLHNMDTEKNPETLEIIHEPASSNATAYPIAVRRSAGGTVIGRVNPSNGAWATGSSVELKENFKQVTHKTVEKIATQLPIKEYTYKDDASKTKQVGPTAEDFRDITGYGDGESVDQPTFLGLTFRVLKTLWAKNAKLEEKVEALEAAKALKSDTSPEV